MRTTSSALGRRPEARLPRPGSSELLDRGVELVRGRDARWILDLGSGNGEFLSRLHAVGLKAAGLDLCRPLLEQARRSVAPDAALLQGDAERLPVASGRMDLVTCLLVAHYLEFPHRALSEMSRILRPGGWLVMADRVTSPDPDLRGIQQRVESLRNPSVQRLLTSEELANAIRWPGFCVQGSEFIEEILPLESWLGGVAPDRAARVRRELLHAPSDLGGLRFEAPDRITVRMELILARKP